ncbi:MAG: DUF2059 domain-containing protein [Verrucomicrobiota bacterium]
MKSTYLFAAVSIAITGLLQAAPPSDQSINEMMQVLQSEKMFDAMVAQMDAGMKTGMEQSLQGKKLSAEQRAGVEKLQGQMSTIIKEELSFAKTKDFYVQAYRDTFTQEEVNSIITFYSSPAGKALVQKIPLAMQKAGSLMQSRIAPIVTKLQKMQEDLAQDLGKPAEAQKAKTEPPKAKKP